MTVGRALAQGGAEGDGVDLPVPVVLDLPVLATRSTCRLDLV